MRIHADLLGGGDGTLITKAQAWDRCVEQYCRRRADEFTTLGYKRRTRTLLLKAGVALEARGLACHPSKFGLRQTRLIGNVLWPNVAPDRKGLASSTRRQWLSILNQFLMEYRPPVAFDYVTPFPGGLSDVRDRVVPRVALTRGQARRVLYEARRLGPIPYGIVAFELTMGLRRSEVLRLRVDQVNHRIINLLGKGWRGGKWREVPRSKLVEEALPELLRVRQKAVEGYTGEDTGHLFCHIWHKKMRPYSINWVDTMCMRPAFRAAGVNTPGNLNHSLRRTFGRTLWEEGVPIELISQLLGHERNITSMLYLSIDLKDKSRAMARVNRVFSTPGPSRRPARFTRQLPRSGPQGRPRFVGVKTRGYRTVNAAV